MSKNLIGSMLVGVLLLVACKKQTAQENIADEVTTKDFVYNIATKNITPDELVNAKIASPIGVKLIYCYLSRANATDSLIHIELVDEQQKNNVNLTIPKDAFSTANIHIKGVKLAIKHIDNSSFESFVKVSGFVPPLPKLEDFAGSLLPDANGNIQINGKAISENGVKRVEIYDDSQSSYTLVETINNPSSSTEFTVNYNYVYRANTANVKVVVVDNFDLTAEKVISVPVLPYTLLTDLVMGAQGSTSVTVNNNTFIAETGTLSGSCNLNANEALMDFLFYGTSNGPTFYSPTNTTNVAANFRCNGTSWSIENPSNFKATRFRVLVPGNAAIDNVYASYNANSISNLDDSGLFNNIPVPSGSTARFDGSATATTAIFNTTTSYLIWVRIPRANGTFRNCLIRAKEVVVASTAGLSTIKFDIYIQK
ncbi:MAG: hypothetical protein REI64_00970 [Pedobacter sp.]|uniref:hypothetical protein n=1 Tax=Pedobacter sp. TaxID=1411316 RepID=UPI00280971A9|nr:hypothetical protein [Pedobacter sp.]MDQ8003335.1 hypothetical protein [Pedobacter sp.]